MVRMITCKTTVIAALGAAAAAIALAAPALADTAAPIPAPGPMLPGPVLPAPDPAPAPAAADPTPAVTAPAVVAAPAPAPALTPTDGVPHLSSPTNLPPGTTEAPPENGHRLSYLRDLWHAVQTQEISGSGALLLLTQRPMDPDATSPNGLPSSPQAPLPQPAPVTP